jgi:hypothetical protein
VIFFAISHHPKFGTLYAGGPFTLTHKACAFGTSNVRVDCSGRGLIQFTGASALPEAMKFCERWAMSHTHVFVQQAPA